MWLVQEAATGTANTLTGSVHTSMQPDTRHTPLCGGDVSNYMLAKMLHFLYSFAEVFYKIEQLGFFFLIRKKKYHFYLHIHLIMRLTFK